jgi:hypothetical protein
MLDAKICNCDCLPQMANGVFSHNHSNNYHNFHQAKLEKVYINTQRKFLYLLANMMNNDIRHHILQLRTLSKPIRLPSVTQSGLQPKNYLSS